MPNQFTHPWTEPELIFLQENITKLTYKQMGDYLKRSPASIQSKIRYLPFQQKIKKHPVNSDFFKAWSSEMAYTLGFIAADGNVCHTGRAHALHIACDDKDVVEKIRRALCYQGPLHQKVRMNGKISYSLRICDLAIFHDLVKLNITERKSLTLKPPALPAEYIHDFVRGYFDGDGSVSSRSKVYQNKLVVDLYTASPYMASFLYKVVKTITKNHYQGKIQLFLTHQKTPYYVVRLGHKASLDLFSYMYENASIYLERKYNKFLTGMSHA
jgi:hypothetical protein